MEDDPHGNLLGFLGSETVGIGENPAEVIQIEVPEHVLDFVKEARPLPFLSGPLAKGTHGEAMRFIVGLAFDIVHPPAGESGEELQHPLVQMLKVGLTHTVKAIYLVSNELVIGEENRLFRKVIQGTANPLDQSPVFSHVISSLPDELRNLLNGVSVFVGEENTDCRLAGIPTGGPVHVDKEFSHVWARQGSNLRPTGYEPAALPLSYGPTLSYSFPFPPCKKTDLRGVDLVPAEAFNM